MSYTGAVPDTEPGREWMLKAACKGLGDAMFPDNNAAGIAAAKRVCARCPVWEACLNNALDTGDIQWGVRGGLTDRERRALAKERATNTAALPDLRNPRQPRPATLAELFARRTTRTNDGHVLWYGSEHVQFKGRKYTALQAAFAVGHGRDPEGIIRRSCGSTSCYRADHLTDAVIRDELAVCGSTAGYHAHRKRGEDPCPSCKRARAGKAGRKKAAA